MHRKAAMKIIEILKELTIEEKAALCSGKNFWLSQAVQKLNIPALRMNDGPHGMRVLKDQSHLWARDTVKAICFPTASALAASWKQRINCFGIRHQATHFFVCRDEVRDLVNIGTGCLRAGFPNKNCTPHEQ